MAIDYEAPRQGPEDEEPVPFEAAAVDTATARGGVIDVDDGDTADSFGYGQL